jgi:hypothetical protein
MCASCFTTTPATPSTPTTKGGVDRETVQRVAEWMNGDSRPVDPADLREGLELGESKLMTALVWLEDAGALEIRPDGKVRSLGIDPAEVEEAMEGADERRSFDRSRLEMMRSYAETSTAGGPSSFPTSASPTIAPAATATTARRAGAFPNRAASRSL